MSETAKIYFNVIKNNNNALKQLDLRINITYFKSET